MGRADSFIDFYAEVCHYSDPSIEYAMLLVNGRLKNIHRAFHEHTELSITKLESYWKLIFLKRYYYNLHSRAKSQAMKRDKVVSRFCHCSF